MEQYIVGNPTVKAIFPERWPSTEPFLTVHYPCMCGREVLIVPVTWSRYLARGLMDLCDPNEQHRNYLLSSRIEKNHVYPPPHNNYFISSTWQYAVNKECDENEVDGVDDNENRDVGEEDYDGDDEDEKEEDSQENPPHQQPEVRTPELPLSNVLVQYSNNEFDVNADLGRSQANNEVYHSEPKRCNCDLCSKSV